LAVGLKFARVSGVMAPNTQGQGQTTQKANAQAPGAFSGGRSGASQREAAASLPRGRDWRVEKREFNGREFYNLVARPGMRSLIQILEEAILKVHEWVTQQQDDRLMVSYTMFVGRAKKDRSGKTIWPKVVMLIGRSGVAIQIPNPVIIGRVWDLLVVAKKANAKISPYDFSNSEDADADYDSFNPPEDGSGE